MPRGFASIFDECLAALSQGDTLEACLARYPKHAQELRTHLLLAQRVSQTPQHQPRPVAQAMAWQRFQLRAQDMRMGRKPPLSLSWARPIALAAALVLALLGAAGGTVYASQDALPDSPLYRVKLATEDARVWFTFDEGRKAELLLDQSNERTEEIMEMLSAGKPIPGNVLKALRQRNARAVRILEDHPDELALLTRAREQSAEQEDLLLVLWGDLKESARDDYAEAVATLHNAQLRSAGTPGSLTPDDVAAGVIHIAGTAQPVAEEVWLLGGVEVRLETLTLGDTQLQPGQTVEVIAARGANGRLIALNIAATDGQQPGQKFVVSGALEEVGDNEVVIAGQRIAITERTLLKLRLKRGQQVEISVEEIDGRAVAASVEGPVADQQEEAPALLAYEGTIEDEVSTDDVTNDWVVGGQRFTVTPTTEIDARAATLAKGARARVEAVAADGEVIARRVVILADGLEGDAIRIEGVLEKGDGESWTVSGVEVAAPAAVETPEVGSLVTIEGHREDRRLVTERLVATFDPDGTGLALLRGRIGRIDDDGTWQVGLLPVQIAADTVISGAPQVGSRVFIWASRDDGSALKAIYVNVFDRKPLPPD